jgi:hypothetical protein
MGQGVCESNGDECQGDTCEKRRYCHNCGGFVCTEWSEYCLHCGPDSCLVTPKEHYAEIEEIEKNIAEFKIRNKDRLDAMKRGMGK